jgi:cytochrome oxidase assembly protein ShyY1
MITTIIAVVTPAVAVVIALAGWQVSRANKLETHLDEQDKKLSAQGERLAWIEGYLKNAH